MERIREKIERELNERFTQLTESLGMVTGADNKIASLNHAMGPTNVVVLGVPANFPVGLVPDPSK